MTKNIQEWVEEIVKKIQKLADTTKPNLLLNEIVNNQDNLFGTTLTATAEEFERRGREEEHDRWAYQTANEHDERIRKLEREEERIKLRKNITKYANQQFIKGVIIDPLELFEALQVNKN